MCVCVRLFVCDGGGREVAVLLVGLLSFGFDYSQNPQNIPCQEQIRLHSYRSLPREVWHEKCPVTFTFPTKLSTCRLESIAQIHCLMWVQLQ